MMATASTTLSTTRSTASSQFSESINDPRMGRTKKRIFPVRLLSQENENRYHKKLYKRMESMPAFFLCFAGKLEIIYNLLPITFYDLKNG